MTGQPFTAVAALVLAGAGCMVGPNYRRPDVVTPPSWGELAATAPPAGRSDAVADGIQRTGESAFHSDATESY